MYNVPSGPDVLRLVKGQGSTRGQGLLVYAKVGSKGMGVLERGADICGRGRLDDDTASNQLNSLRGLPGTIGSSLNWSAEPGI